MSTIRKIGCFVILAFPCLNILAQQQTIYSQYILNKFLYNPAVAGVDGYTSVNILAKQEMVGFENPPTTFVLSGQTRLLEDSYIMKMLHIKKDENKASRIGNVGIGASIFSDHNGIISKTGFQLTYAYHLNFNNKYQLSFGLSLAGYQFKLNDAGAVLIDPSDPLLNSTKKSFFIPDANAGTFLLTDAYYVGASMSNLFGSALKIGKDQLKDYTTPRYYYFLGGYKWYPIDNVKIEPSFIIQATQNHFDVDINTTANYNDQYWIGLSYRTSRAVILMAGVGVRNLYFGYAYDMSLNEVRNYTSGSHELMMGIRFGDNDARRARWVHKDMKTFENK
jgi:type IX secretion system PorP/SprF family membrane protein